MPTSAYSQQDNSYVDISIAALLRRIRQRWYWLLVSAVLTTAASIFIAFTATPIYQSSILVAPAGQSSTSGGGLARMMQSFSGGFFGGAVGGARNNQAIALSTLTSPFFMRAFIEENNLLPILFEEKWDAEKGQWAVDDADDIPTLSEAYKLFESEIIDVFEQDYNQLVTIYIEWKDPLLAAEWANKIIERVNTNLRQQAIQDADLTISFLNEELAKTSAVQLQQSIYFLIEAEIQKRTVAKVQKEYAYRVLSPAFPADLDKFVTPNRAFIISVGAALGLFLGLLAIFVAGPVASRQQAVAESESK